jgi:hypothetical protein
MLGRSSPSLPNAPAMPRLLAALLLPLMGLTSCDNADPGSFELHEGDQLEVVTYAAVQPESRQAYADLATMIVPGRVAFIRPAARPELVRTISIPGLLTWYARTDRDGYVWVATPDEGDRSVHRSLYVIDPHEGTVHRAIRLPEELRGVEAFAFGPDRVYVRAWREGRSVGLGAVRRSDFAVEVLAELDSTGTGVGEGIALVGGLLYLQSTGTSETEEQKIHQFDVATNALVRTAPYAGYHTMDGPFLYTTGYFQPGVNTLYKLDAATLEPVASVVLGNPGSRIAHDAEFLYIADYPHPRVEVRSKETLALVRTLDFSEAGPEGCCTGSNAFGFITREVLLLNERSAYDVATGELMPSLFPLDEPASQALELAEGRSLQSFP